MTVHARVAIIGGGIYGCGLLYQLVEKGWRDVVLLEKNELTAGSTWHAAGFCTHYTFNATHGVMRKVSTELFARLEQEGSEPTGYHRCQGLRITSDRDRMDEFRHGLSVGRQFGIDFEMVGPSEIAELCPILRTDGLVGGIFEPLDGYVDPAQATHAMARLARAGGARILRESPVTGIERMGSGEWRLETPSEEIIAEHIVIAAGIWSNEVGALIGLDLPIVPMLHQYLVTEDHPDIQAFEVDTLPFVRHHDQQWYVRRERDGLILGAYESTPQTWSVDGVPPEFGMELLPADLDRIEHLILAAVEQVPVLGEAGIKTVVHGPISYTPDGQPLIGPAPGITNAWIAAGSGFGIGEGPGAGLMLAEWITEGAPPMHMLAFDPRRFGRYADKSYRIEKAVEVFSLQFATHYPHEEREAGRPSKQTPIYPQLATKGAHFGAAYGWERANWFATEGESHELSFRRTQWFDAVGDECRAMSEAVGVVDLSGFTKYRVTGRDAGRTLDRLSANRLPRVPGPIRLCHFLNDKAGVECEFTVTRIDEHEWYLVCAAVAEQHHRDWLLSHAEPGSDFHIENLSESHGVLGVGGPRSRELLTSLTRTDLGNDAFPWLSARSIELAGVHVQAMRVSYAGELGWEIHHALEDQAGIYAAVCDRGEPLRLRDVGFYALNSMRMEKAYKAWGVELTVENTPWELGLDRFIALDGRDFIGRGALIAQHESGVERKTAFVEIDAHESDPIGGEAVFRGETMIGVMLSGAYGHRVGKSLGFALVEQRFTAVGTNLSVEIIGERRTATVIAEPAFDPRHARPRADVGRRVKS